MYGIQQKNDDINEINLCGLHSYSTILSENGMDIDDRDLFGLLNLYDLRCYFLESGVQTDRISDKTDAFCITGMAPIDEKKLNLLSNVFFSKEFFADDISAMETIHKNISMGQKVIAFADVFYLKYHPLYGRYHGQTQLLICNEDNDNIYISDYHLPTSPISIFAGWIDKGEFMQALLLGKNIEQSGTSGIITYSAKNTMNRHIQDVKKAVCDNFVAFLKNNFNTSYDIGKRVNRLFSEITCKDNFQKLAVSAYAHITGRAGMVISRKAMAEILDRYECDGDGLRTISEKWQGIAGAFFRLSLRWNPDEVNILGRRIEEAIDLEYKEVNKCVKKLMY